MKNENTDVNRHFGSALFRRQCLRLVTENASGEWKLLLCCGKRFAALPFILGCAVVMSHTCHIGNVSCYLQDENLNSCHFSF